MGSMRKAEASISFLWSCIEGKPDLKYLSILQDLEPLAFRFIIFFGNKIHAPMSVLFGNGVDFKLI